MEKFQFAMAVRFTDKRMRSVYFFYNDSCSDHLFRYPCKDPNSKHLEKRIVAIFDKSSTIRPEWFTKYGADVIVNPSDDELKKVKIVVVMPNNATGYYDILDYYVHLLQKVVRLLKTKHNYKHIIVVLPADSDEYSTELSRMAYYAVYGLVKGLGKLYAPYSLFVNGVILNRTNPTNNLEGRITYLASDNSCNTIGQIFKL